MRTTASIIALALLATPALADKHDRIDPKGEAELAKLIGARVAGKPTGCINQRDITDSQVIDHTAIVYRVGQRLYVNRPQIGADQLDNDDILVTRSYSSDLCRIDTVRLVDRVSHFERGFVSLGDFVPYTPVKVKRD